MDRLPPEIWSCVFAHADKRTLKACRLVCRAFDALAVPALYNAVTVYSNSQSFERLAEFLALADDGVRYHARTLTYDTRMVYYRAAWYSDEFLVSEKLRCNAFDDIGTAFEAWQVQAVGRGKEAPVPLSSQRHFLDQFTEAELRLHYANWKQEVEKQAYVVRSSARSGDASNIEVNGLLTALETLPTLRHLQFDSGWDKLVDFVARYDNAAEARAALQSQDPLFQDTLVEPSSYGGKKRVRTALQALCKALAVCRKPAALAHGAIAKPLQTLGVRCEIDVLRLLEIPSAARNTLASLTTLDLDLNGPLHWTLTHETPYVIGKWISAHRHLRKLRFHYWHRPGSSDLSKDSHRLNFRTLFEAFHGPVDSLSELDIAGGVFERNILATMECKLPNLQVLHLGEMDCMTTLTPSVIDRQESDQPSCSNVAVAYADGDPLSSAGDRDNDEVTIERFIVVMAAQTMGSPWTPILASLHASFPSLTRVHLVGPLRSGSRVVYHFINGDEAKIRSYKYASTDDKIIDEIEVTDGRIVRSRIEKQIARGTSNAPGGCFEHGNWPWLVHERSLGR